MDNAREMSIAMTVKANNFVQSKIDELKAQSAGLLLEMSTGSMGRTDRYPSEFQAHAKGN